MRAFSNFVACYSAPMVMLVIFLCASWVQTLGNVFGHRACLSRRETLTAKLGVVALISSVISSSTNNVSSNVRQINNENYNE